MSETLRGRAPGVSPGPGEPTVRRPLTLEGRSWLGIGVALLLLSLVSTLIVFAAGVEFDPDDHPGSYYRQEIPWRIVAMIIGLIVLALSAAATVLSLVARPRGVWRVLFAALVLVFASLVLVLCWQIGLSGVESARRFAEEFPG